MLDAPEEYDAFRYAFRYDSDVIDYGCVLSKQKDKNNANKTNAGSNIQLLGHH
jgi:hypothetical protein